MTEQEPPVYLSAIDENRFGIRTARGNGITVETLPFIMSFCRERAVDLLIARCSSSQIAAAQAMESLGFLLMDTLVYYALDLENLPDERWKNDILVRPYQPGEKGVIQDLAREAFRGYFGHYHADPRLDKALCDEAYSDWAAQSCEGIDGNHEILLAEDKDRIAGFYTIRLNSGTEGEGVLVAIHPDCRGRGVYRALCLASARWCRDQGRKRIITSTQIRNLSVQRTWTRAGSIPLSFHYTFHKWFDR